MKKQTPSHRELLHLIAELGQSIRFCRQDALFCEGVTFTQFLILDAVAERQPLSMAELHEILAVDKSTTSRLVRPLIDRGLLQQRKTACDGRSFNLAMTPDGVETHERTWHCFSEFADMVLVKIPRHRRGDIKSGLALFAGAIAAAASSCRCDASGE